MTSHLVWFESEDDERYLNFWKGHVEIICQQKRGDLPNFFKRLADEQIINMTKEMEEKLKLKFYDTAMKTLNICPGFGFIFKINILEAEELDKSGKLKFLLAEKIKEGLKVVGLDGKEVLKTL
jgi:hypothetical protein